MPEGPDGKTIIIVKKVSGHGGHHGGAWKVAFADFVTAMMALFMVLWLVNSASVRTRERIASYFKQPGVFELGSGSPLEIGGAGILPEPMLPPQDGNSQTQPDPNIYVVQSPTGPLKDGAGEEKAKIEMEAMQSIAAEIKKSFGLEGGAAGEKALGDIEIKVDQRGLHLDIMDTVSTSMFQRGSSTITPAATEQLRVIAKALSKLPNPIDIEGHTDAVPFRSKTGYDNWDLSVDRANAARRLLQAAGLQESQIARVVGFAAQRPKLPDDPKHFSNRRITISMRYTDEAANVLRGSGVEAKEFRPGEQSSSSIPVVEDPTIAPKPLFRVGPITDSKKLNVEMRTSLPEGAAVAEPETPNAPLWETKDKIFGGTNPFSGQ